MSVQNQEKFLKNVAKRLGRPRRTAGVVRPEWTVYPQYKVFQDYSQEDLIQELKKQCKYIHTTFKRTDKQSLHQVLKETIQAYDGKLVIASNDPRNKAYGLDTFYHDTGVHVWEHTLGKENIKVAEQADVGITFSDITLAESATVTLLINKDNGRSISLLPKTYIAIIPKDTLVPRMTQAAKHIREQSEEKASCISFISGPSNSADIEMNLIVGVHGPVKATYILVD